VYAQDPLEGFTQRMEEWNRDDPPKPPNPEKVMMKKGAKKRKGSELKKRPKNKNRNNRAKKSFVISKEARRGNRVVQIKIYDFTECTEPIELSSDESDGEYLSLSAQYVVNDPVDEILDSAESLIHKISKEICKRNL
jgi:hypothetical protein